MSGPDVVNAELDGIQVQLLAGRDRINRMKGADMARKTQNDKSTDVVDWVLVNNERKRIDKNGKVTTNPKQMVVSNDTSVVLSAVRNLRRQGTFAQAVRA